jgi:4-amino-4-deoxy-L-arabinose transferase-like glycosyltransferase
MRIRRSGAYGIAGIIVLLASLFLPMSTPYWYSLAVFCLVCALVAVALFFNVKERRAGEKQRSIGFFVLAVLVITVALLCLLPLVF